MSMLLIFFVYGLFIIFIFLKMFSVMQWFPLVSNTFPDCFSFPVPMITWCLRIAPLQSNSRNLCSASFCTETSACKHSESAYLLHKQLLPHGFKNLSCHVNRLRMRGKEGVSPHCRLRWYRDLCGYFQDAHQAVLPYKIPPSTTKERVIVCLLLVRSYPVHRSSQWFHPGYASKNQTQITRCCGKCRSYNALFHSLDLVLLLPRTRSPKRWTITPPPSILESLAILSAVSVAVLRTARKNAWYKQGKVGVSGLFGRILRSCVRLRSRCRLYFHLPRCHMDSCRTYAHCPRTVLYGKQSCSRKAHRSDGKRSQPEAPHGHLSPHGWNWSGCSSLHRPFPSICFRFVRQKPHIFRMHNSPFTDDLIAIFPLFDMLHRRVKIKICPVFEPCIHILAAQCNWHRFPDVLRMHSKAGDGSADKVFEFRSGCWIQSGAFTAVLHVNLIDILHQLQSFLFADVFIKCAAKIIGNIIFTIGKCSRTAESAHDRTALAVNAAFDLLAVNRTFSFSSACPSSKWRSSDFRYFSEARTRKKCLPDLSDNDYVIFFHTVSSRLYF